MTEKVQIQSQATDDQLQLTRYQKSEDVTIQRSTILNAPYNPRKISEDALTQLRKNFRRVGLLGGIVVNKRTMHIISGHQRLKALDQLEKDADYMIRVEMVDVDETTEIEQNIFMNSPNAQGEFDNDMLKIIVPDIDYSNAALTEVDMSLIGVDFKNEVDLTVISDDLAAMDKKKEHIKSLKKNIRKDIDATFEEGDPIVVLSFDSFKNKAAFMHRFDLDEYEKFIKGEVFSSMVERID